ncbi:MAG TPA: hypothetical protein VEC99_09150 [Clostridia bacterium]|nr:hypothetical protein [Clostridia bacterium]
MSQETLNLINAIANATTALAFFINIAALLYLARQTKASIAAAEHAQDQNKREKREFDDERAVEVLKEWALFTAQTDSGLLHLARQLTDDEASMVWRREEFDLFKERAVLFSKLLGLPTPPPDAPLRIPLRDVVRIRAEGLKLLNMLEWCMSVWARFGYDGLILREFEGLADQATGEMPLIALRKAAGDHTGFPHLVEFEQSIKQRLGLAAKDDNPAGDWANHGRGDDGLKVVTGDKNDQLQRPKGILGRAQT